MPACCCALLALAMLFVQVGHAAPPQWKYMFPAGGQLGTPVEVEAHGTFDHWPLQAWVDRPGVSVQAQEAKGKFAVTVGSDAIPGLYWLRFYDPEGPTPLVPFIVGTLPGVVEQEPNNSSAKRQELSSPNVIVNGRLQSKGDVDTFAVRLDEGQTLVADLEAHRTLGSQIDALLEIVSAEGFVLARNHDDQELDPRIVFTTPKSGVYMVRTFGFPATPNSSIVLTGDASIVYRLTLTVQGFLDYSLPLAVSPETQQVEARGWNLPADVQHLVPRILPSSKQAVLFHPQLANLIILPIERHPSLLASEPSKAAGPQTIELPVTITGRIEEPRDEDSFRFHAKAGETIDVRVESRSLGYPLDPVLTVRDAQEKVLSRTDDSGASRDIQLPIAIPADGEYQITVSDLHRHGGPRYVYRLTAAVARPDFALSLTGDTFKATVGQNVEIPVTVARVNGFKEAINLRVEGLPPGTSADTATSLAEGDSAKAVKLTITAGDTPFAGPIRIIGTTTDATAEARVADAPLAGRPQRTTDIWLTIGAAEKNKPR
jgi:hypothetical protein